MDRNEVTGDALVNNKGDQKKYEDGWDRIFNPPIESPCIGVCQYPNGVCSGCGRTVEEVRNWHGYTEQEKKDTLLRIESTTKGERKKRTASELFLHILKGA